MTVRKKGKASVWLALLVQGLLLVAPAVSAGERPAVVDAATWRVEQAETTQQLAQREALLAKAATPADLEEALARQQQRETRFGELPHAPPDPEEVEREVWRAIGQQGIDALQEAAFAQAERTGEPVGKRLQSLLGEQAKAGSTRITLATQRDGPLNGGYVYAFVVNGASYGASSYVPISATGQATLALPPGSTLDLYLFPIAPFGAQALRVAAVQDGATILVQPARKVTLLRDMPEGGVYAGGIQVSAAFSTAPALYSFVHSTTVNPTDPAIYLAEGTAYRSLFVTVDEPWVVEPLATPAPTQSSLVLSLRRGYVLALALHDPDALLTGCTPSLVVNRDARLGSSLQLGRGRVVYDAGSRPTSVRASLPKGRPLDLVLTFSGATCGVQRWELRGARFTENARLPVRAQAAPRPQLAFRTASGEALGYSYGFFRPTDRPGDSIYFTPSSVSSAGLIAGRDYEVQIVTDATLRVKPIASRFTAQAGSFPVTVTTERLAKLTLRLQPAVDRFAVRGLVQARRNGVLEAAFEVSSGRDHLLELPVGDYQLAFSGFGGTYSDAGGTKAVLLREFTQPFTLTAAEGQRLQVPLTVPTAGVRFPASPAENLPLLLVAEQAGRPIAATALRYWYNGILTDLAPLELRINGPRFDDVQVRFAPTAEQPMVDLAGRANVSARYTGTLRDSAGLAMPATPIYVYAADGVHSGYYVTDAQGRFDLPKVRGGLVMPLAPAAGNDLPGWQPIASPQASLPADLRLQALSFLPVSADAGPLQRLYGSGTNRFRIVFVAESYTTRRESFTDANGNGVWDGRLFLDFNRDGLWQQNEPARAYGQRIAPTSAEQGTDIRVGNEPFVDENADGYPSIDDFAVFAHNTRNYLRALLGSPQFRDGLTFDAYLLFLPSAQAGMDVIDGDGQTSLLERDTRFGARLTRARSLLEVNYDAVRSTIAGYIAEWNVQVVMINQVVPAGRANSFIIGTGGVGNSSPNDATPGHEFGHNPGGLADEYDEFGGTAIDWLPSTLGHLTHIPNDLESPWVDLLTARMDEPLSIPSTSGIGLYAGGLYNAGGAYRPTSSSRMRDNAPEFNAPSRRVLARSFCRVNLTEAQLSVSVPPEPGPDSVFRAGFDPSYTLAGEVCR